MTTYTSKTKLGFFDDEIFGTPTIRAIDPTWQRPRRTLTLQPGESVFFDNHTVTNFTDEPLDVTDVPDADAVPPLIDVANPDCRLPIDATPITEELRVALQAAPYGINWSTEPPTANPEPVLNPAQEWAAYQLQAAQLLAATEREYVALTESLIAGEALPPGALALVAYRRALRSIVNAVDGNPNQPLPARG